MAMTLQTVNLPRRGNAFSRWLGRWVLGLCGWRICGALPDLPRLVIIVAPHTSYWDFFIGVAVQLALGLDVCWLGKHSLFLGPWAPLLRWLGGIPVKRKAPQGLLAGLVRRLNSKERFLLALAPEGTRHKVERWRRGFHVIARKTGALIVPAALDFASREIRFGPLLTPSTHYDEDLQALSRHFAGVTPRRPENFERVNG
jgi:1-acyl-sn-glycerol-3-phosphate acyltransferase